MLNGFIRLLPVPLNLVVDSLIVDSKIHFHSTLSLAYLSALLPALFGTFEESPIFNKKVFPKKKLYLAGPPIQELIGNTAARGEWMSEAYRKYGYTMRKISRAAELQYSSVSKIIKVWEKRTRSPILVREPDDKRANGAEDNSTFKT